MLLQFRAKKSQKDLRGKLILARKRKVQKRGRSPFLTYCFGLKLVKFFTES